MISLKDCIVGTPVKILSKNTYSKIGNIKGIIEKYAAWEAGFEYNIVVEFYDFDIEKSIYNSVLNHFTLDELELI